MIGTQPTGTIPGVVISAIAHEGLTILIGHEGGQHQGHRCVVGERGDTQRVETAIDPDERRGAGPDVHVGGTVRHRCGQDRGEVRDAEADLGRLICGLDDGHRWRRGQSHTRGFGPWPTNDPPVEGPICPDRADIADVTSHCWR